MIHAHHGLESVNSESIQMVRSLGKKMPHNLKLLFDLVRTVRKFKLTKSVKNLDMRRLIIILLYTDMFRNLLCYLRVVKYYV